MGSSTTESGLAQGVQDLRLQPAGWYAVHSLHSARWLAVVPRWVLSSDSPLAALSPLAGSGTPLGTLKWSRPITDLRFSWWSQYLDAQGLGDKATLGLPRRLINELL